MKNIVLFGGAFDPIHNGHINMALEASKQLDADIFFIPARISVWKSESAPIKDKIKMVELAIKDYPRLHVSKAEANSPNEVNYSIDTVRFFKKEYPDSNIFYLIGTDHVNSFHKWKDAKELSKLAKIVFFKRPGMELDKNNIKEFEMVEIDGTLFDDSSTDIRELKSLDTPDSVIDYIINNRLYFMKKIASYMSEDRLIHTISTAKLSYEIALANNLTDAKKVFIAALLHDIGKEMPMRDQREIMALHFKEYMDYPPVIYHQFVGAYLTEEDFGIKDPVILDAIKYHTTANSNMSDVAIIVHCADKIEPTRGFASENLINELKCSLINGFVEVLKSNIEYYNRHNIDYHNSLQMSCLDQYLK